MNRGLALILITVVLLLAAGCSPSTAISLASDPAAWIDAPLNGMLLPLAPYEIVFHITDDAPVTRGEVTINGQLAARLDVTSGENLATLRYTWSPAARGKYTIEARGQSQDGGWSAPAQVVVEVGEPTPTITRTPTQTPTATTTPTPTATPTLTATPTDTATPTMTASSTPTVTRTPLPGPAPIKFNNPRPNTNQIYFYNTTCGRKEVDFYVTIPPAAAVTKVSVNVRVLDRTGVNGPSEWKSKAMGIFNTATGEWLTSVNPELLYPALFFYTQGRVEYQFTAVNEKGTVSSQVFDNVSLDFCR